MSDRVAVFNDGAIQQVDVVTHLYEKPANSFVANFVGDNTIFQGILSSTSSLRSAAHCEIRLANGDSLRGLNVNAASAGQAVNACIRPERILVHTGEVKPAENCVSAMLRDVIYFGDHLRLRCEVERQAQATVKIPLSSIAAPPIGQAIWLHLPPEHLRIYR